MSARGAGWALGLGHPLSAWNPRGWPKLGGPFRPLTPDLYRHLPPNSWKNNSSFKSNRQNNTWETGVWFPQDFYYSGYSDYPCSDCAGGTTNQFVFFFQICKSACTHSYLVAERDGSAVQDDLLADPRSPIVRGAICRRTAHLRKKKRFILSRCLRKTMQRTQVFVVFWTKTKNHQNVCVCVSVRASARGSVGVCTIQMKFYSKKCL